MNWRDTLTPTKGERMPMTEEHFTKVIAMRDELIDDQREEISKLKMKVNKLQQKLNKKPATQAGFFYGVIISMMNLNILSFKCFELLH